MKLLIIVKTLSFAFLFSIVFASCTNNIDLSNVDNSVLINESLVLPIGEAKVSIQDVLDKYGTESIITLTGDDNIYFQMFDSAQYNFRTFQLASYFESFDKNIKLQNLAIPVTVVPANSISVIPIPGSFKLGFNGRGQGDRLDRVVITNATMKIKVDVTPDLMSIPASNLSFTLDFPANRFSVENGTSASHTPTAYGAETTVSYGKITFNTDTIINGETVSGATTLPFTLNLKVNGIDANVFTNPTSTITISMYFTDLDFETAYGKFKPEIIGNSVVKLPLTMKELVPNSFLRFANPIIKLKTTSSLGADLKFQLDYLKASTTGDPLSVKYAWFEGHTTNSKYEILAGPINYGDAPVVKEIPQLDNANGELDQLFDTRPYPDSLEYKFSVFSAPVSTRAQDFVTSNSYVKVNIEAQIPMALKSGSYFDLKDSIINVNTTIGTALDNIDSAVLVLKVTNGLPIKANYSMTLWDDTNLPISTSMITDYVIEAPAVNDLGYVDTPATGLIAQLITIKLSKVEIAQLKKTSKIKFTIRVDGRDTTKPIHITTTNNFTIKFGVFVNVNVSQNPVN